MTIANPLGKAEKDIELDRDQWAALDKISFKIKTRGSGEAIGGPFYFGRAFDAAPFFTFSAVAETESVGSGPQLTVGVAEWIQDDQDMYTGANLWFKYKHTDQEGSGQVDGCRPSSFYGDQVLHDPGFEGHHVRGPNDGELPILTGALNPDPGRLITFPSTYPTVFEDVGKGADLNEKYPWVQQDVLELGGGLNNTWRDNHSFVHSGSHSVSHDWDPFRTGQAWNQAPFLYPVGVTTCTASGQTIPVGDQFGWPTRPGHQVKLSCWARASGHVDDVGTPRLSLETVFYSGTRDLASATGPGSDDPGFGGPVLTFPNTNWFFIERNVFTPEDVAVPGFTPNLVKPFIFARRGTFPTEFFGKIYVDDAKLTLSGGTSSDSPVSTPGFVSSPDVNFQVDIRFNGQILKSYAHVHPIRSYEHPAQVVLS